MRIEPIYYAIFYDVSKPKTLAYAMNKRISEKQWINLTDGIECKEVELRRDDDSKLTHYKVLGHVTFQIFNTVDNHYYAVFDVKVIPQHTNIFEPVGAIKNNHKQKNSG